MLFLYSNKITKKVINGKKQNVQKYKDRLSGLDNVYGVMKNPTVDDVKKSHLAFEDNCRVASYMRSLGNDEIAQDIANCNRGFTSVVGNEYFFDNNEEFWNKATARHIPFYHCNNRFCAFCSVGEARERANKVLRMMCLDKAFYNHKLALGTLTVTNLKDVDELKKLIKVGSKVINSFNKVFKCAGSIKKIEMTYNNKRKDYHLHFHVIMAFTRHNYKNFYLNKNTFASYWCSEMGNNGFIANVKGQNLHYIKEKEYINSAKEVSKYEAKSEDYANNGKDVFKVFYEVFKNRQVMTTSGCFRDWVSLDNEDSWHIIDMVTSLVSLSGASFKEWTGAKTTEWRADDWKYDDFRQLSDDEFNKKILPLVKGKNRRNYYLDYLYEREFVVSCGKEKKLHTSHSIADKIAIAKCKSRECKVSLDRNKNKFRAAKAYCDKPKIESRIEICEKRIAGYNKKLASGNLSLQKIEEINKKKDSVSRSLRRYKTQLSDMNNLIASEREDLGLEFEEIIEKYKSKKSAYYRYTSSISKLEKLQKLAQWLDANLENILFEMIDFDEMKQMADNGESVFFRFKPVDFVLQNKGKGRKLHFRIDEVEFKSFIRLFLICLNWRQVDFNFDTDEFLSFSYGFERDFRALKDLIVEKRNDKSECKKIMSEKLREMRRCTTSMAGTPKAVTPFVGDFSNSLAGCVEFETEDDLPI